MQETYSVRSNSTGETFCSNFSACLSLLGVVVSSLGCFWSIRRSEIMMALLGEPKVIQAFSAAFPSLDFNGLIVYSFNNSNYNWKRSVLGT